MFNQLPVIYQGSNQHAQLYYVTVPGRNQTLDALILGQYFN